MSEDIVLQVLQQSIGGIARSAYILRPNQENFRTGNILPPKDQIGPELHKGKVRFPKGEIGIPVQILIHLISVLHQTNLLPIEAFETVFKALGRGICDGFKVRVAPALDERLPPILHRKVGVDGEVKTEGHTQGTLLNLSIEVQGIAIDIQVIDKL